MSTETETLKMEHKVPSAQGPALENGNTPVASSEGPKDGKPRTTRPKRPNYAEIHAKALPLEVYPLPAYLSHSPLSIVWITAKLISDTIWRPSSHVVVHKAYFSPETQSVHVTEPAAVRALWEQGFFGTGSLSRSEPRWLDQEKRKRGANAQQTSEEVTRKRRQERRQFKLERARLEREAIEQQRRLETGGLAARDHAAPEGEDAHGKSAQNPGQGVPGLEAIRSSNAALAVGNDTTTSSLKPSLPEELLEIIEDQEHLQLTLEEAFFLSYTLGALHVYDVDNVAPPFYLLRLFCAHSQFPLDEHAELQVANLKCWLNPSYACPIGKPSVFAIAPDNPFLLKYVVYHHFRSLGWVVRPGVKFAVDYLIYNRGPAFSHAEFGIIILPAYSHEYWTDKKERTATESRDWWWLHRVNRVQSAVHKTLMVIYVEIPPPWDHEPRGRTFEIDIGNVLKTYKVREMVVRRWTPNRHRD